LLEGDERRKRPDSTHPALWVLLETPGGRQRRKRPDSTHPALWVLLELVFSQAHLWLPRSVMENAVLVTSRLRLEPAKHHLVARTLPLRMMSRVYIPPTLATNPQFGDIADWGRTSPTPVVLPQAPLIPLSGMVSGAAEQASQMRAVSLIVWSNQILCC
ncbi:hypothetical protein JRQ81_002226, partial [Phrynocephalus forsythii]